MCGRVVSVSGVLADSCWLAGLLVERVRAAHRLTAELDAQQLELERLNILARHLLEASDQWYTPSAMMTIDNNGGQ